MAAPPFVGDLLDNESEVFRAFSLDGHRRKRKIRARCFYRMPDDTDGISVGRSPDAAVSNLHFNHGYCSLRVALVHAMPHELTVRADPRELDHALIHNVPYIESENDAERERAELIAGALARAAVLVTDEPYTPARIGPEPVPDPPQA